ncbi:MAG: hypothetical protein IPK00_16880 [Deltaproteobacteria bacterium]|nr:hypothetical protein [Deltaproteobacteria bacterium]
MPRDLSDVLHYFLPELERAPDARSDVGPGSGRLGGARSARTTGVAGADRAANARRRIPWPGAVSAPAPAPLSVLCVPIGERDLVHAAFTWSLAVETARQGGSVALVAPEDDRHTPLWSGPRSGTSEPELVYCRAEALADLRQTAADLAVERSRSARQGGIIFTRIPPRWLDEGGDRRDAIRWILMFSSPRREDATATFERIERMVKDRPGLEIGITIHGVRRIAEARDAFDELARRCEERLGLALASYGLLTDDLDIYRAIAAGRSIGETHPDSPAARALADVARLIYEDARSRVLG